MNLFFSIPILSLNLSCSFFMNLLPQYDPISQSPSLSSLLRNFTSRTIETCNKSAHTPPPLLKTKETLT